MRWSGLFCVRQHRMAGKWSHQRLHRSPWNALKEHQRHAQQQQLKQQQKCFYVRPRFFAIPESLAPETSLTSSTACQDSATSFEVSLTKRTTKGSMQVSSSSRKDNGQSQQLSIFEYFEKVRLSQGVEAVGVETQC